MLCKAVGCLIALQSARSQPTGLATRDVWVNWGGLQQLANKLSKWNRENRTPLPAVLVERMGAQIGSWWLLEPISGVLVH